MAAAPIGSDLRDKNCVFIIKILPEKLAWIDLFRGHFLEQSQELL
jgi:hypothetical protein